ncbi:MAG TPA: histidinol-phosphate transaminase [Steroidobacteraceae bacterium]|jgi:histidinol-phosphate aminotransferase|nr:histidinol-phosphate transaminase [Steroidobacteraceae bacterium]
MNWLTEIARPEIRAMKAYEHAVWEPGLIRLHANELPWRAQGDSSIAGLNRYPEPHPQQLTAALARFYGVGADMLLAGRGSDELIDLLIRSYCRAGKDAVIICPPTFGMYAVAARIQGASVLEVPLQRDAGYGFDPQALLERCTPGVKLVFLCSPNNPTGNRLDSRAILGLARALEGRALVVVDEAYVEFADAPSLTAGIADHPGMVVLRTLSKAHGLAGARCGALLGHAAVVALLRKVIQPYAVTQLTIEAVLRSLESAALEQSRGRAALLRAERVRVAAALAESRGVLKVWPSDANFLLVEFQDAAAALQRSHAAGLLVRDLRAAPGLARALRISIGTTEQNDRLLASLRNLP